MPILCAPGQGTKQCRVDEFDVDGAFVGFGALLYSAELLPDAAELAQAPSMTTSGQTMSNRKLSRVQILHMRELRALRAQMVCV